MNYTSFDGTTHLATYRFQKPSLFKRLLRRARFMVEDADEREAMEGMRHLSLKAFEDEERR
jgi:hypothetical protein